MDTALIALTGHLNKQHAERIAFQQTRKLCRRFEGSYSLKLRVLLFDKVDPFFILLGGRLANEPDDGVGKITLQYDGAGSGLKCDDR